MAVITINQVEGVEGTEAVNDLTCIIYRPGLFLKKSRESCRISTPMQYLYSQHLFGYLFPKSTHNIYLDIYFQNYSQHLFGYLFPKTIHSVLSTALSNNNFI